MKRQQIPQKLACEKFYVLENIVCTSKYLSKIYFLENPNKTSKPNNQDLNRYWIRAFWSKWFCFYTINRYHIDTMCFKNTPKNFIDYTLWKTLSFFFSKSVELTEYCYFGGFGEFSWPNLDQLSEKIVRFGPNL